MMSPLDYSILAVCTLAYVLTFIYQGNKIKLMETLLKSQSDFVNSYEKYKLLLNDTLDLRLQKQKNELEAAFRRQSKELTDLTLQSAINTFQRESEKMMKGWEELSQIAIGITLNAYPTKSDKVKRDDYIRKHYPNNSAYFIEFIDDHLDGKINP